MDTNQTKQLIENVLGKLCVSCDSIELTEDAATKRRQFAITSDDSSLLIGMRGEHLAALNHIVRALARRQNGSEDAEPDFSIDVNNYRRSRIETVLAEAREAAERARLFERPVELSPMSSYERLVVHSFFSDIPDVTTESFGEGRFRRVVVKHGTSKSNALVE